MTKVNVRAIRTYLGAGVLAGIALVTQPVTVNALPPEPVASEQLESACTEINLGRGFVMVDCGSHRWCYYNNVFQGSC
jgi:hypothetical protein